MDERKEKVAALVPIGREASYLWFTFVWVLPGLSKLRILQHGRP